MNALTDVQFQPQMY